MLSILFATYAAVFAAEIVGDKLLHTTGTLAMRYRTLPIFYGMMLAFVSKMGVAVLLGNFISRLPPLLVASVTTLNFFAIACILWREPRAPEFEKEDGGSRAAAVSFAAIFFSEWGDLGQLTVATMATRFGAPFLVWLGAVAAMVTKGALAASVGAAIRLRVQDHLSRQLLRYAAAGFLLILGLLSAIETVRAGYQFSGLSTFGSH